MNQKLGTDTALSSSRSCSLICEAVPGRRADASMATACLTGVWTHRYGRIGQERKGMPKVKLSNNEVELGWSPVGVPVVTSRGEEFRQD